MKVFPAKSPAADSGSLEEAAGALADASLQQEGTDAFLAVVTESDIGEAVVNKLNAQRAFGDLQRREQQLVDILTTIIKEFHGGRLRLTQSQLDEAKGWQFDAGPGTDGVLHLSVKYGRGKLVTG